MLTKRIAKIVQNLEKRKFRDKYNLFKVEGEKLVNELILTPSLKIDTLLALDTWTPPNIDNNSIQIEYITEAEMKSISNFDSPPTVIALVEQPTFKYDPDRIRNTLSIVLDGIQDPGNLGTIIRLADWFGVKDIFCSTACANIFNSKVIQSTMGAIFRVKVHYVDLNQLINEFCSDDFPCYGAFLEGKNIYNEKLSTKGFILMGNEGHGISKDIAPLVNCKITIPSFANNELSTESLNVGVATGIILSEFKRTTVNK